MNLSSPGITYLLLVFPTLFALVVVGQGAYKVAKEEPGGEMILVFGIIFLILIGAAYWFLIR